MFRRPNTQNIKGFTLVELLVVIAIVAIMASIGLAMYGKAREQARDRIRIATTEQIALAMKVYEDTYGEINCPDGMIVEGVSLTQTNSMHGYIIPTAFAGGNGIDFGNVNGFGFSDLFTETEPTPETETEPTPETETEPAPETETEPAPITTPVPILGTGCADQEQISQFLNRHFGSLPTDPLQNTSDEYFYRIDSAFQCAGVITAVVQAEKLEKITGEENACGIAGGASSTYIVPIPGTVQ